MQKGTQVLRYGALIVAAASALALASIYLPIGHAQNIHRPFTPDQLMLVAKKHAALRGAGTRGVTRVWPQGRIVQAGQPTTFSSPTVQVTKAQLIAAERSELNEAAQILAGLSLARARGKEIAGADAAMERINELEQIQREHRARLAELERLPDTYVEDIEVPAVEVGTHSIQFSTMTYQGSQPKDPINVVFYGVGSASDVRFDLKYWTSSSWKDTECGATQQEYIWDAQHIGGWNGWRTQQYQLELNAGWYCGSDRYHLRLFEGFVRDSHNPSFEVWSVTDAHHDPFGHQCTDDWEGAEDQVEFSFRDGSGNPLWFVGSIWYGNLNNSGQHQCAYNDGNGVFIQLNA